MQQTWCAFLVAFMARTFLLPRRKTGIIPHTDPPSAPQSFRAQAIYRMVLEKHRCVPCDLLWNADTPEADFPAAPRLARSVSRQQTEGQE
jgi:hypothetical protein